MRTKFFLSLAAVSAIWLISSTMFLAPDFGGVDLPYFKDAGLNLALGNGLVSNLTYANTGFENKLYAIYPPLFPLIFGLFLKIFGVTMVAEQAFDSLLIIGTLFLTLGLFPGLRKGHWIFACAAVCGFAMLLPAGLVDSGNGRADGMGFLFAVAALYPIRVDVTGRRLFLGSIFCGLAAVTSPISGILGVIAVIIVWLFTPQNRCGFFQALLIGFLGTAIPVVLWLGVFTYIDGTYLARFFAVFSGAGTSNETGGGFFLKLVSGDIFGWFEGFKRVFTVSYTASFLKVAFVLAVFSVWVVSQRNNPIKSRPKSGVIVLIMAIGLIPMVISPYQQYYLKISSGLMFALVALYYGRVSDGGGYRLAAVLITGFAVLNAPSTLITLSNRLQSGASLERFSKVLDDLSAREILQPGAMIVTYQTNYAFFYEKGYKPVFISSPAVRDPDVRRKIDFYALTYYGTGKGDLSSKPKWWSGDEYELLYKPNLPQTIWLIPGVRKTSSSRTWELEVYRRAK